MDPVIYEKMVALTRGIVDRPGRAWAFDEAKRIVALLPEPIDPRLVKASEIITNWRMGNAGEDDALDTAKLVQAALA